MMLGDSERRVSSNVSESVRVFPASYTQQQLWLVERQHPGLTLYHVPKATRLRGPLNLVALQAALDEIVRRHEILRSNIVEEAGTLVQVVHSARTIRITSDDLRSLDPASASVEVARITANVTRQPFDMTDGPLLRAHHLRLADDDHVLLLVMHHAITDGWSFQVFRRELSLLYDDAIGIPSHLEALDVGYADYASWQHRWVARGDHAQALAYWRNQLAGVDGVLELPSAKPRSSVQSFRGARVPLVFDSGTAAMARAFAVENGATLFMTLLAAFQVLVGRYTGRTDFLVGCPFAGRSRPELDPLIGCFVNIVPLRADLSGAPTFAELVRRVRRTSLEAFDHQELPFAMMVREAAPSREQTRTPLVQVLFSLEPFPDDAPIELSGLDATPYLVACETSHRDLTIHLWEDGSELKGYCEYDLGALDANTVEQLTRHFGHVVRAALSDPTQPIDRIPTLPEVEQDELLDVWSVGAPMEPIAPARVHELVAKHAETTPEALAVVYEERRLTYRELNERANRLAHHLRRLGVLPGDVVGIYMERSDFMVLAVLGVLKTGSAYLALDRHAPSSRLRLLLQDAGVKIVVTAGDCDVIRQTGSPLVAIDASASVIADESPENPQLENSESELAYVLYTSGSTGHPKGVAVEHHSIVQYCRGVSRACSLEHCRSFAMVQPLTVDSTITTLFGALLHGACLHVISEVRALDAQAMAEYMASHQVDCLKIAPSHLAALCLDHTTQSLLPRLRLIIGGEASHAEWARQLQASAPAGCRVFNHYGPTEATVGVLTYEVEGAANAHHGTTPLGRPLPGAEVYILDQDLRAVPPLVSGEIYIAGPYLARGYWRRDDATAESFSVRSIGGRPPRRLYRTGDLGRWTSDGFIEFLGRTDDQIKIRGYRVEPAEVEAAVLASPLVKAACVLGVPDQFGEGARLLCYVVAAARPTASEVSALRERHVEDWQTIFDAKYHGQASVDARFDLAGWHDSYTGRPLPALEMREWVSSAARRVLRHRPEHVVEIGCGTGLLLFAIAPHCVSYLGTDFSTAVLAKVERELRRCRMSNVQVAMQPAHATPTPQARKFDVAVLNSIVHCFPDLEYLTGVLQNSVAAVRDGGVVFVGDVRSLPLLHAFELSVLLATPDSDPDADLRARIDERADAEKDLVIDPLYFLRLVQTIPRISHVTVQPKRGRYRNELTRFRYDVELYVGQDVHVEAPSACRRWEDGRPTIDELRRDLQARPLELCLSQVRNARVARLSAALTHLSGTSTPVDLRRLQADVFEGPDDGIDPEDLWRLAEEVDYDLETSWLNGSRDGAFDVSFRRRTPDRPQSFTRFPLSGEGADSPPTLATTPIERAWRRRLVEQLRAHASAHLPEHMIPMFRVVDALPLTPHGKVARKPLLEAARRPAPRDTQFAAPIGDVEERLARWWTDILGLDQVGRDDSFFSLGGDSILCIQLVARAREAGLRISVADIFEHHTIAGLASIITPTHAAGEQATISGEVPLTPIQRRLFDLLPDQADGWTTAVVLDLKRDLDSAVLGSSLEEILTHHDALRSSFQLHDGSWRQWVGPSGMGVLITHLDLSCVPPESRGALMRAHCEALQRDMRVGQAPLIRVAMVATDSGVGSLVIIVHHLVIDAVSWGILLEDLERVYLKIEGGGGDALPPKSTSFKQWAERLAVIAERGMLNSEAEHWLHCLQPGDTTLPLDWAEGGNSYQSRRKLRQRFSRAETRVLITQAPGNYHAGVDELLLAALALALFQWTGRAVTAIELEGHGRIEELAPGLDLSRTIGWFTSAFPTRLRAMPGAPIYATVAAVRKALREVPNGGIGFGVLRYASPDREVREQLSAIPRPEVRFNYTGRAERSFRDSVLFAGIREDDPVPVRGEDVPRPHLLEINAGIRDECLWIDWCYSTHRHRRETIAGLADSAAKAITALVGPWLGTDDALPRRPVLHERDIEAVAGRLRGAQ